MTQSKPYFLVKCRPQRRKLVKNLTSQWSKATSWARSVIFRVAWAPLSEGFLAAGSALDCPPRASRGYLLLSLIPGKRNTRNFTKILPSIRIKSGKMRSGSKKNLGTLRVWLINRRSLFTERVSLKLMSPSSMPFYTPILPRKLANMTSSHSKILKP